MDHRWRYCGRRVGAGGFPNRRLTLSATISVSWRRIRRVFDVLCATGLAVVTLSSQGTANEPSLKNAKELYTSVTTSHEYGVYGNRCIFDNDALTKVAIEELKEEGFVVESVGSGQIQRPTFYVFLGSIFVKPMGGGDGTCVLYGNASFEFPLLKDTSGSSLATVLWRSRFVSNSFETGPYVFDAASSQKPLPFVNDVYGPTLVKLLVTEFSEAVQTAQSK
jgi:hypothetical protein